MLLQYRPRGIKEDISLLCEDLVEIRGLLRYLDNIIYLPGKPGDVLHPFRACSELVLMSTYEELSLIVSVALLIVAILNLKNKK